ncbi:hypothetical protein MLD38_020145 [Melastoma candidum]|uniref:Uncharacterized protein n=1 Tax=Melastoma candidum TaxID=119954 RepID=A0ACB9QF00_9MYRT|nr:hypothetical protein MLD38_020145 [Melastoma candidum]
MGVCGLSMGGVHTPMVGSLHPTPIATLPFLSPHSAVAFCEGILKHGTAWEALREDPAAQTATMTLEEVRERMRNVLSLTDVTCFPIPKNPSTVIFVAATDDGYIPKHSVLELQKAWPGSEVRWVTGDSGRPLCANLMMESEGKDERPVEKWTADVKMEEDEGWA